ncbi:hypothetical protein SARC_01643 [Sphaeroforma arctica JP610]|uniref:Uncharacterized protein n=1 Tax=Sphaeroforma arctica JP610 TaxID=667725 RepID=A0A0L0GBD7_9EUKA|nr:hypothetical protein SARC_01643 [Sphaeroforma arctica JP610]KNC86206.1 hypothetical protein SARC_01643 [Sphaeroforma arctica JP610]|eukprot:XP_014160108.1 hypothetical protein SARC_01643 [Sphaeroforma arctica JP610]
MLGSTGPPGSTHIKWACVTLSDDNYDRWDDVLYLAALGDYKWDLNLILNYCELLKPLPQPGAKPIPYEPIYESDSTLEFRNAKKALGSYRTSCNLLIRSLSDELRETPPKETLMKDPWTIYDIVRQSYFHKSVKVSQPINMAYLRDFQVGYYEDSRAWAIRCKKLQLDAELQGLTVTSNFINDC